MSETKWRALGDFDILRNGDEESENGGPWREIAAFQIGEQAAVYGRGFRFRRKIEEAIRSDEAAEPQPVVVAAFIAPENSRWEGMAVNVTSDGAWWIIGLDGKWMRTAPPIAAKGGNNE